MSDDVFWVAVGASGTVGAMVGAFVGVWVAWHQLRQLQKASGSEAVLRVYELFDDESRRQTRKKIWQSNVKDRKTIDLQEDELEAIQRISTDMDVVGTMVKHHQIEKELVFERYLEVIIPLWNATKKHISNIRIKKGGWDGKISSGLPKKP